MIKVVLILLSFNLFGRVPTLAQNQGKEPYQMPVVGTSHSFRLANGLIEVFTPSQATWSPLSTIQDVQLFNWDNRTPHRLVGMTSRGYLWVSMDAGTRWTARLILSSTFEPILIEADSENGNIIRLEGIDHSNAGRSEKIIYRSVNGGRDWIRAIVFNGQMEEQP